VFLSFLPLPNFAHARLLGWLQKAVKGIQGFAVTEQDLNDGITAEQFMRGLNLDREKGTFEWIDLDAPTPAVASASTAPALAIEAAQPMPVEDNRAEAPSPPRSSIEHSRGHSPLSLSQVAGFQSASPSPLTPVFNIDTYMDVDPPVAPESAPAAPSLPAEPVAPSVTDTQSTVVEDEGVFLYNSFPVLMC
jgi:hypothetical protein